METLKTLLEISQEEVIELFAFDFLDLVNQEQLDLDIRNMTKSYVVSVFLSSDQCIEKKIKLCQKMSSIKKLDLSNSQINDLSFLNFLPNLEYLIMYNCNLTNLPNLSYD